MMAHVLNCIIWCTRLSTNKCIKRTVCKKRSHRNICAKANKMKHPGLVCVCTARDEENRYQWPSEKERKKEASAKEKCVHSVHSIGINRGTNSKSTSDIAIAQRRFEEQKNGITEVEFIPKRKILSHISINLFYIWFMVSASARANAIAICDSMCTGSQSLSWFLILHCAGTVFHLAETNPIRWKWKPPSRDYTLISSLAH